MLRIIHTADWHLGQTFYSYDRSAEHAHFLQWLLQILNEQEIDVLLIAGDIFDTANPSAVSQRMFYRFLQQASAQQPNLQIIVIAGNHDSAARLEAPQPLVDDRNISIRGIIKRDEEGKIIPEHFVIPLYNKNKEEEALCLAVPYLHQGDYPGAKGYEEGVKQMYRDVLTCAKDHMVSPNEPIVAMGHFYATNAEIAATDASEHLMVGGLDCVDASEFGDEMSYTALGHIHKAQRVAGHETVRYAGAPLSMTFAEIHYHHGVQLITLEGKDNIKIDRLEYQPLVNLLSLPEKDSFTPDDIVKRLSNLLPDISDEDVQTKPYLEIKVELDSPDPSLQNKIDEVLSQKAVRFCRIKNTLQPVEVNNTSEIKTLEQITPSELAQLFYEDHNGGKKMPDELINLMNDVIKDVEENG